MGALKNGELRTGRACKELVAPTQREISLRTGGQGVPDSDAFDSALRGEYKSLTKEWLRVTPLKLKFDKPKATAVVIH